MEQSATLHRNTLFYPYICSTYMALAFIYGLLAANGCFHASDEPSRGTRSSCREGESAQWPLCKPYVARTWSKPLWGWTTGRNSFVTFVCMWKHRITHSVFENYRNKGKAGVTHLFITQSLFPFLWWCKKFCLSFISSFSLSLCSQLQPAVL